ncbi:MAG: hypothetical protein C5S52_00530 [ANME-2 cluster archaeon]|nr:hypothetical protein [ANME-2 cluster archaeon]
MNSLDEPAASPFFNRSIAIRKQRSANITTTRYQTENPSERYGTGLNSTAITPNADAAYPARLDPMRIGSVSSPIAESPSMSSMSFAISRAIVASIASANSPDAWARPGISNNAPPYRNVEPVRYPTEMFPASAVRFRLRA